MFIGLVFGLDATPPIKTLFIAAQLRMHQAI
ncbi:MAG: hypothetical protein ACI9PZ_002850 [Parvicella sp.]|jgi:hypothetical protein